MVNLDSHGSLGFQHFNWLVKIYYLISYFLFSLHDTQPRHGI